LSDDETGLNGLSEPDFIGKDASAFRYTAQCKHNGIYLVWIRIDTPAALRGGIPPMLIGPA
jgi:hypothetical protein